MKNSLTVCLSLTLKLLLTLIRQIKYAANDVLTAMAIVLKIVAEQHGVDDLEELLRVTYDICLQHKDIPFKGMYRFFFTY